MHRWRVMPWKHFDGDILFKQFREAQLLVKLQRAVGRPAVCRTRVSAAMLNLSIVRECETITPQACNQKISGRSDCLIDHPDHPLLRNRCARQHENVDGVRAGQLSAERRLS